MRNFKKILITLAITAFAVLMPKTGAQAANTSLPATTPIWFDAEYYATVYPDVYNAFAPNIQAMGGLDNAMWLTKEESPLRILTGSMLRIMQPPIPM